MEEKTGIWLKRNGRLERCNYYELEHSIDMNCRIHIYHPKGHNACFEILKIQKSWKQIILYLSPISKIHYCNRRSIDCFLPNENDECRLMLFKSMIIYPDTRAYFYTNDTTFWGDNPNSRNLKIVIEEEPITDVIRGRRVLNKPCASHSFSTKKEKWERMLENVTTSLRQMAEDEQKVIMYQGGNHMKTLKNKIKKVIYVDKPLTVNHKTTDKDSNEVIKSTKYNGMVKVFWTDGTETIAYTNVRDEFNKEEGFKTCVMKYVFGNAETYESVDFWTNKYVKYPSSCIEVTEALCKLEKIIRKDTGRSEGQKGLTYAKFFRETGLLGKYLSEYKQCHKEHISEFKKLAKKHFLEMKGKEIYINHGRKDEIFVAIK